jgi:hypothetical protein
MPLPAIPAKVHNQENLLLRSGFAKKRLRSRTGMASMELPGTAFCDLPGAIEDRGGSEKCAVAGAMP